MEIRPVAVELVDGNYSWQLFGLHEIPEFLGQWTHSVHRIQNEQNAVHSLQQVFHISCKIPVAGHIYQKMAILVPEKCSARRLNGAATANFFGLIVQARSAFLYRPKPAYGAGIKKKHLRKRSFAAAACSYKGISALHIQWTWHIVLLCANKR